MQLTHSLKSIFIPRSVAVVGASDRVGSRGTYIWKSVMNSRRVFEAYPVNPKYKYLGLTPCWAKLSDLPVSVDLVVIATPSDKVMEILKECARLGLKNVLITPGSELFTSDRLWRESIAKFALEHQMHLIGPDSTGIMRTDIGLNVSYIPELPNQGHVALIAQSSSIASSILDYARAALFGFSSVITAGAEADISIDDMVEFFHHDPQTRVIALHIESISNPRKFYLTLSKVVKEKPVVILKTSRHIESQKFIATRLSSAVGDDAMFDALIHRIGAIRCSDLDEFCATIEIFNSRKPLKEAHLSVVANGLGYTTLLAESMAQQEITAAATTDAIARAIYDIVPSVVSESDPINLGAEASCERYLRVVSLLTQNTSTNALMLAIAPTPTIDFNTLIAGLREINESSEKLICVILVEHIPNPETLSQFRRAHIPVFLSIPSAMVAYKHLTELEHFQSLFTATPEQGFIPSRQKLTEAQTILDEAQAEKRHRLTETQTTELLKIFGISTVKTQFAGNISDALSVSGRIGYPVAVKLCAQGIYHRSDFGGVVLNCKSESDVKNAFETVRKQCQMKAPMALFEGVLIQEMAQMPMARTLSVSVIRDPLYGPGIQLGAGGVTGEIFPQKSTALLPLTEHLARDLILRSPVARALKAFRGMPQADIDKLVQTLMGISHLVTELPSVLELSINPLFVDDEKAIVIDPSVVLNSRVLKTNNDYSHLICYELPIVRPTRFLPLRGQD